MEGHAVISADVLASYAADAAREVSGVHGLVGSGGALHRHGGVKVTRDEGRLAVELRLTLDCRRPHATTVGAAVQSRVADYLVRMADVRPDTIDVVVDAFAPPVPE